MEVTTFSNAAPEHDGAMVVVQTPPATGVAGKERSRKSKRRLTSMFLCCVGGASNTSTDGKSQNMPSSTNSPKGSVPISINSTSSSIESEILSPPPPTPNTLAALSLLPTSVVRLHPRRPKDLITSSHKDDSSTDRDESDLDDSIDVSEEDITALVEGNDENQPPLLPPIISVDTHKACLVIDLDETLVHSSFKPVKHADFVISVEIESMVHEISVMKRPHVDVFLELVGQLFECVLFTASLAKYAGPVVDLLDRFGTFRHRLYRDHCTFLGGSYVKDLSLLGRSLKRTAILDNSPFSYSFQPNNAIPITSWIDDESDSELLDLMPFLKKLHNAEDFVEVLKNCRSELARGVYFVGNLT